MRALVVVWIGLWVAGVIGWIMNLCQLFSMAAGGATAMFILKCIGAVLAPIGAVLGWLG